MPTRSLVTVLAIPLAAAVAIAAGLTGCSATASGGDGTGTVSVVASTNVYGDIAKTIAGDAVKVTSIMNDPAQDPHSFEVSAQNQLAVSKADVVIENGGGYDDFMDSMLRSTKNTRAQVLNVVQLSGTKAPKGGDLNEHVWYDFPTIARFTDAPGDRARRRPTRRRPRRSRATATRSWRSSRPCRTGRRSSPPRTRVAASS